MLVITSGSLKQKRLVGNMNGLRPTTNIVRQALMNLISDSLVGSKFLDCFAGTGIVGFEAISRGAKTVGFVENHPRAIRDIQRNASLLGVEDRVQTYRQDVFRFLENTKQEWDFLFFSPPFLQIHWYQLFRAIEYSPILTKKEGVRVCIQHPNHVQLIPLKLKLVTQRAYGMNHLSIWELPSNVSTNRG